MGKAAGGWSHWIPRRDSHSAKKRRTWRHSWPECPRWRTGCGSCARCSARSLSFSRRARSPSGRLRSSPLRTSRTRAAVPSGTAPGVWDCFGVGPLLDVVRKRTTIVGDARTLLVSANEASVVFSQESGAFCITGHPDIRDAVTSCIRMQREFEQNCALERGMDRQL